VKSANISGIRATVLSWASTADAVTSDIVGTWGATPTWATNWADNATPADLTVTSDWTTVKVENIAIDESTVNNLALAIWLPNEETIGDIVYISQVQMNMGSVALPFQPKSYGEELRACQRYAYFINQTASSAPNPIGFGFASTTGTLDIYVKFPVTMRTLPAHTYSALADLQGSDGATGHTSLTASGIPAGQANPNGSTLQISKAGAFTQFRPYRLEFSAAATTASYVGFIAEL